MGPKGSTKKASKEGKAKREPSAYNIFLKSEIAKVKAADASLDHKEAFRKAGMRFVFPYRVICCIYMLLCLSYYSWKLEELQGKPSEQ